MEGDPRMQALCPPPGGGGAGFAPPALSLSLLNTFFPKAQPQSESMLRLGSKEPSQRGLLPPPWRFPPSPTGDAPPLSFLYIFHSKPIHRFGLKKSGQGYSRGLTKKNIYNIFFYPQTHYTKGGGGPAAGKLSHPGDRANHGVGEKLTGIEKRERINNKIIFVLLARLHIFLFRLIKYFIIPVLYKVGFDYILSTH